MSHTPGPWEAEAAQRGFIISALNRAYDIAVIRDIGNLDNRANARLIAAAPTMASYITKRASAGDAEAQEILENINGNS